MNKLCLRFASVGLGILTFGRLAHAVAISGSLISPTTALPPFTYGSTTYFIDQIADGITNDDPPFNGFAANGIKTGTIRLDFAQEYDLASFTLWNDINVSNEGVRSFRLDFFNSSNVSLGSTGVCSAVSQFSLQVYSFPTVNNVKWVNLLVLTSSLQIEIRELAFDGKPSALVAEPASSMLFAIGLIVRTARRNARRGAPIRHWIT